MVCSFSVSCRDISCQCHNLCTKGVARGGNKACTHARTVTGKRITVFCADTKDTLFAYTDARKASWSLL